MLLHVVERPKLIPPFLYRLYGYFRADAGKPARPLSDLGWPLWLVSAGHELNEFDLSAVIKGLANERGKPVVNTYYRNYHSVRNERFRMIQYPDGTGELYDMQQDPWEWKNLYLDPDYTGVRKSLAHHIPKHNEPYSTIPWERFESEKFEGEVH